jgi:hypothetical protein
MRGHLQGDGLAPHRMDEDKVLADAETAAAAEETAASGRSLALGQLIYAYAAPSTSAAAKETLKASILANVQALSKFDRRCSVSGMMRVRAWRSFHVGPTFPTRHSILTSAAIPHAHACPIRRYLQMLRRCTSS